MMAGTARAVQLAIVIALAGPLGWSVVHGEDEWYWGDLHCHTRISWDAIPLLAKDTAGAIRFARDVAGLDFVAITDHDTLGLNKWSWRRQIQTVNNYNAQGAIVVFAGYEYTDGIDGHRNVVFKEPPSYTLFPSLKTSPFTTLNNLWALFDSKGLDALTIPHHTAVGDLLIPATNWGYVHVKYQPVAEIYSGHGSSESNQDLEQIRNFQFDHSVFEALNRWFDAFDPAYKMGVVASTDDHQGRSGGVAESQGNYDAPPQFTTGGLVCVKAAGKNRNDIFEGLKNKHTYATTGARIVLSFDAEDDGGTSVMMGDTLEVASGTTVTFTASATGENAVAIEKIELIKNGSPIFTENSGSLTKDVVVTSNAWFMVKVYQVKTARWDGAMINERAWSSPIWVELLPP